MMQIKFKFLFLNLIYKWIFQLDTESIGWKSNMSIYFDLNSMQMRYFHEMCVQSLSKLYFPLLAIGPFHQSERWMKCNFIETKPNNCMTNYKQKFHLAFVLIDFIHKVGGVWHENWICPLYNVYTFQHCLILQLHTMGIRCIALWFLCECECEWE